MDSRKQLNWKAAALPLAAFTAMMAVGINYFVGSSGREAAVEPGSSSDFKFDTGPRYAPGSAAARGQAAPQGSSIDMFREVNKNYAAETAEAKPAAKAAARPKNKKELQEFMRQVRSEISFDPAAMAAAEAQGAQGPGGRNISNPILKRGAQQQEQEAAAVYSRPGAKAAAGRGASSLAAGKSSFSTGRLSGSGLSSGGGSGMRNQRGISGGSGDAATGQSTESGYNMSSGGGRSLEAGSYGSHGGGMSSAPDPGGPAGGAQSGPSSMAGAPQQEQKAPPAPVAFVWQRSVDFGTMYMYETAVRQVIVMNIGNAPMKLGKIDNLDDETPFNLEKDKCSGATVQPGKSCTFRIRFSPKAVKEYLTGFEIPSDDRGGMDYQSYIEVKGVSKYSYSTWWWHHNWSGAAGYNNRLNFGMVPEGFTMDQVLRITNNSANNWDELKLDKSKLPSDFKLSGDGCTGQTLGPRQSCAVTVTFAPTAAGNRKFSSGYYGQYHSVNMQTGAKLYHSRPSFPPLVMEKPVEASPSGKLRVIADYVDHLKTGQTVLEIPVEAQSSAPFPVKGLVRVQHYFYFQ